MTDAEPVAADADLDDCDLSAGDQSVDGTIRNTADQPRDFVISIGWTDENLDSLGGGYAVVKRLGAGKEADFTVQATVAADADQCIPVVLRGTLAKLSQ